MIRLLTGSSSNWPVLPSTSRVTGRSGAGSLLIRVRRLTDSLPELPTYRVARTFVASVPTTNGVPGRGRLVAGTGAQLRLLRWNALLKGAPMLR